MLLAKLISIILIVIGIVAALLVGAFVPDVWNKLKGSFPGLERHQFKVLTFALAFIVIGAVVAALPDFFPDIFGSPTATTVTIVPTKTLLSPNAQTTFTAVVIPPSSALSYLWNVDNGVLDAGGDWTSLSTVSYIAPMHTGSVTVSVHVRDQQAVPIAFGSLVLSISQMPGLLPPPTSETLTIVASGTSTPSPEPTTSVAETGQADLRTKPASVSPFLTDTPSNTSTPTSTDSATNIPTNTSPSTATATQGPLTFVVSSVTQNADWTPVEKDFGGVIMVLVPAGCFEMGDATDVAGGTQCFDEPFWIDRYEVSNDQFIYFDGEANSAPDFNHPDWPRVDINWFEASSFCQEKRGGFLPTEAEWEYAARGPERLIYPWGHVWNPANLVWSGNSSGRAADIGSRAGGVSWVGAHDLSGNVWEWVSTMYDFPYPYATHDGREASNEDAETRHVMRGGSLNDNDPTVFSTFYRNPNEAERYWFNIGFRCARAFNRNDLN